MRFRVRGTLRFPGRLAKRIGCHSPATDGSPTRRRHDWLGGRFRGASKNMPGAGSKLGELSPRPPKAPNYRQFQIEQISSCRHLISTPGDGGQRAFSLTPQGAGGGVRGQESGVRGQESGVKSQGSRVRGQESGVSLRHSEKRGGDTNCTNKSKRHKSLNAKTFNRGFHGS